MSRKLARITIFLVVLLTAGAVWQATKLKFDYEFEHFFPTDDEDLEFYQAFMDKFSTDVDFVLVAIENREGIFQEDFLKDVSDLQSRLSEVKRIERVISPVSASSYALGPFGPIAIPYLHADQPELYASDSTRIYTYNKGVGNLFSADAKSIALIVMIEEHMSKTETDTVYADMMAVLDDYAFDALHTAGKAVGQAYYIRQIENEFYLFFTVGLLLITLTLVLIYRSVWGTIVPLIVVLLSVVWILGYMGLVGKTIDIMVILLPLVLFVVGISDVIHLMSRYFEEIRNGFAKDDALKLAYRKVGIATFLTSATTAVGFLTLLTSEVRPVRELGLYVAIGVMMAFVAAFTLLPAILTLSKVPALAYREPSSNAWNKLVRFIFKLTIQRPKSILAAFAVIVIASGIGISKVHIDSDLMQDMGKNDPHRLSFNYFEKNFAGVRPFELQLSVTDSASSLLDPEHILQMVRLEEYLTNVYGVRAVHSPLTIVKTANQALNGGRDSAFVVPTDSMLHECIDLLARFRNRPEFKALMTSDNRHGRFSGKMIDSGARAVKELDNSLVRHFTLEKPLNGLEIRVTGMPKLIDKNNETLSINMMSGLAIAMLIIALLMGFAFKSLKMALISLVPNIIPLLAVGGVMGFTGIDLKVSTSVIFGIAFGIAVDDTIHYLIKFRQELRTGKTKIYALKRSSISTGKAIIITTVVLCSGFLSLITSDFTSIFYVGFLMAVALFIAVLADLFLLPVLLRLLFRS